MYFHLPLHKLALCISLLLAFGNGAFTVSAQAPAITSEEVTVITSERLLYDYNNAFAVFEENVVVVDPKLRLTCDRMTVRFNEKGELNFLEARGQVYIQQDDKTARAEMATYDVADGKIVLEVNPQVMRGGSILQGGKITFWRNENKMHVEGGSRLIIPPSDKVDPTAPPAKR